VSFGSYLGNVLEEEEVVVLGYSLSDDVMRWGRGTGDEGRYDVGDDKVESQSKQCGVT
jgi:hypothetical protein